MARLPSRSRLTAWATALVIAYAAAAVAYGLGFLAPVRNAENGTLDWRFLFRGPVGDKHPTIALITFDEGDSLDYWAPLPRRRLARVIDRLHASQVQLVGLDVFLEKPSFDAAGDALLLEALRRAGNVVLASSLKAAGPEQWRERRPHAPYAEAALDWGYALFFTDTRGEYVREGQVAVPLKDDGHLLSLAGVLWAQLQGLDTAALRRLPGDTRHEVLPGHSQNYRRLIDYSGPPYQYYRRLAGEAPGGFVALSSRQLLAMPEALARGLLAGRVVLVGSGLDDAGDRFRTPFFAQAYGYEKTFGVEVHAQFLRSLLAADPLLRCGFFFAFCLTLVPAFLTAWGGLKLRPIWALPLAVGLAGGVWIVGFYAFSSWRLVVPLLVPTLAVGFACVLSLAHMAATEGRRRNAAHHRLGPMLGPEQVERLLQQPEIWNEEGGERPASALWLHIRLPPDRLNPLPSRQTLDFYQTLWARVSAAVFSRDGMVFRYEQDGMAAVFGAPLPSADHPSQAVETAVEIADILARLRAEEAGDGDWGFGLGVDAGRVLIGDLAQDPRPAVRSLGRPVERARQLAQNSGEGGVFVTQALRQQVGEGFVWEAAGQAQGEAYFRVEGRAGGPAPAPAPQRAHPFWKYLRIAPQSPAKDLEDFVAGVALFDDFSRGDLRRICPLLYRRSYGPGEAVFSQGEIGSAMYIIRRGACDIVEETSGRLLQRLEEGEFFGELALLSDLQRSAAAIACRPSELLVLFQSDMYQLVERHPELGMRLIRTLSRVLGERLVRFNEEAANGGGDDRA